MARPRKGPSPPRFSGSRAVIYLRVSADDLKNEKHGLEVQQDYCTEYVERNHYTVTATEQDDGISGTKGPDDRPGLAAVLAMVKQHTCDVVVCYAADRVSRSVGLFDAIRQQLITAGVRLETFKENMDFTRPEGQFMGDIYSAFAAEERRRIAARLYGGRRVRSKKDGLGSGTLPWGYRRPAESADAVVEVDEAVVPTIRRLFALRQRGLTYQTTADRLNAQNLRAPRGGRWTVGQVQAIERHRTLYRTGLRVWDGVEAAQPWPILLQNRQMKRLALKGVAN